MSVAGEARRDSLSALDPLEHIVRDPRICGGQPVFRGTRVLLRGVLGYLARGETTGAILAEFPTLSETHIRAAIAFAAASAAEDLPVREPPPSSL